MRSPRPLALALALSASLAACGEDPVASTDAVADAADFGTVADTASDTASDTAADTVADTASDTASDTAADTASDTASDTAADAAADAAADTASDAAADAAADTVADVVADTAADAASDTAADTGASPCEPWTDTCGDGHWCWFFDGVEGLSCGAAGPIAVGEVCTEADGPQPCVAGALCVMVTSTEARCVALCDAAHQCPSDGQVCLAQAGYQGLGDGTMGFCGGDACTPPADGCPDGEKCVPSNGGQTMSCVPAGTAPVGGACSDSQPCVPGAICGPTTCLALCDAGADCPAADEHCVWPVPEGLWGVCGYGDCDPVSQEGCLAGEGCYIADSQDGSTLCWDAGAVAVGGDCADLSSMCVPGAECIGQPGGGDTTYTCRAFCDAEHPCDAGLTCQSAPLVPSLHFCLP